MRYTSGISSTSFLLSWHIIMSVIPARLAARIFSFIPPTGNTLPRSVISPVIAVFLRTLRWVSAEAAQAAALAEAEALLAADVAGVANAADVADAAVGADPQLADTAEEE